MPTTTQVQRMAESNSRDGDSADCDAEQAAPEQGNRVARLAAIAQQFDDQLRQGMAGRITDSLQNADTSDAEQDRLGDVLDCLVLLERAWPRSSGVSGHGVPQCIGKFQIQQVIGQGGFGIVYLAVDTSLGRQVALKVPRLHALANSSLLQRFQREARAAAALDHPHIVPVYESGEDSGLYYIATAYCPGRNLSQWLKDQSGGLAWRTAAGIVRCLADAVAHSHERDILHRDIKPGNVMLVPRAAGDEPASAGRGYELPFVPKLADFGLAKFRGSLADGEFRVDGADETATAAVLGTPAYMSPEQAGRSNGPIGEATDVYSLGVVLYELLVGRPPFQGPHAADVIEQVRSADPVRVREFRRDVPRNLETICLKCLEKAPDSRYESAAALRDDLDRCLSGEPIAAKPPGAVERWLRWLRRHPSAASVLAVCVVFVSSLMTLQARHTARMSQANKELQEALTNAKRDRLLAQRNEREAREINYALDINNAWRAKESGDFPQFQRIIDRYRDGSPLAQYRGLEWHHFRRATEANGRELLDLEDALYDIQFLDDQTAVVVGKEPVVRFVDVETGRVKSQFKAGESELNSVLLRPNSNTLWTAGDDGVVRRWGIEADIEGFAIAAHSPNQAFKVVYSDAERLFATCGNEGTIRLFDSDGNPAGVLEGHTKIVHDLVLLQGGRELASASNDRTLRTWDLRTQKELWRFEFERDSGKLRDLELSPTGENLAICCDLVWTFNLESQREGAGAVLVNRTTAACWHSNGRWLFIGDQEGVVHVFEMNESDEPISGLFKHLSRWQAHEGVVYSMRLSPDGQTLLTAGKDGRLMAWSAVPSVRLLQVDIDHPRDFQFDPHGRWLAAVTKDLKALLVFDQENPDLPAVRLRRPPDPRWIELDPADTDGGSHPDDLDYWRVAVAPNGSLIASVSGARLYVWEVHDDDFTPLATHVLRDASQMSEIAFTHDGRMLALATETDARIVDPRSGDTIQVLPTGSAVRVCASPTEDVILINASTHTLQLWHWPTATLLWETPETVQRPAAFTFTPDGRQIIADSGDRTLLVFDRTTGALLREFGSHHGRIKSIVVSPDGRTIACATDLKQARFWHAHTEQLLFELSISVGDYPIAFAPDGSCFAFAGPEDGFLQLLPLAGPTGTAD